MVWWVLLRIHGSTAGLWLGQKHAIRHYVRLWAKVRAAGHHWHGKAWDISTWPGTSSPHTFVRLHLLRHVGRHHEVWAAFVHHSYLISVLIHVSH